MQRVGKIVRFSVLQLFSVQRVGIGPLRGIRSRGVGDFIKFGKLAIWNFF